MLAYNCLEFVLILEDPIKWRKGPCIIISFILLEGFLSFTDQKEKKRKSFFCFICHFCILESCKERYEHEKGEKCQDWYVFHPTLLELNIQ